MIYTIGSLHLKPHFLHAKFQTCLLHIPQDYKHTPVHGWRESGENSYTQDLICLLVPYHLLHGLIGETMVRLYNYEPHTNCTCHGL